MSGSILQGRRIVVTGGSSGIGRAIAVACAREGADLLVTWRHNAEGAQTVAAVIAAMGRRCVTLQADLADAAVAGQLAEQAWSALGGFDGWVHNAGADILTGAAASATRLEKLARVLDVDVRGTMLCAWQAAARMREAGEGVILTMSWDHVSSGLAGENPEIYAAAKGAVEAFSKALARSAAPAVRVNVLAPGFIATAFEEEASLEWRSWVEGRTPLGRWGRPEDVAGAAVYLLSDAATFVTGQTVKVNGGVIM